MSRAINWLLPLATLAVYGWLVIGYGIPLTALADGLPPPDLRVLGYDLPAIRAWLLALPPAGAAMYLGPVARLDTAFPLLMGLTLMWWMRPYGTLGAWVAVTSALVYVGLDLAENRAVARLIAVGPPGLDGAQVAAASALTRAKFLAFALAAVLAARQSWRRWSLWRLPGRPQAGGTAQD